MSLDNIVDLFKKLASASYLITHTHHVITVNECLLVEVNMSQKPTMYKAIEKLAEEDIPTVTGEPPHL